MAKFRVKSSYIEAVQFNGEPIGGVELIGCKYCWPHICMNFPHVEFGRNAHHGITEIYGTEVNLDDWLITLPNGLKQVMKPDLFQKTYELVEGIKDV